MSLLKVVGLRITVLVVFCLGIGLQTPSVSATPVFAASAVTISSSTQTGNRCQYNYKNNVYNDHRGNSGFVHLWAGTCSDNVPMHMNPCSSSMDHFWISINISSKISIKC